MAAAEDKVVESSAMEIDNVETEQEMTLALCPHWQAAGKCRYGGAGEWCESGYHPPKESTKATIMTAPLE